MIGSLDDFENFIEEKLFRQRALDVPLIIDDRPGDGHNSIPGRQVGKLAGFDGVGPHQVVLEGKLIGQAHGPGTVRSGRCDEDLQVQWLGQLLEFLPGLFLQPGLPFRHGEDRVK